MAHIIISYSSKDRGLAVSLASDLEALGHDVWFDAELTRAGGQKWWSNILANLRQCDLFIFALTPNSLTSEPCKHEYGYAYALRKRILPVMLESVDVAVLPAPLQEIQFVDYCERSTKQALALAATLNNLPPAEPMPDPLPPEPETPLPPLARLSQRLDTPSLSGSEQVEIIFELERLFNDPTTHSSAEILIRTLYGREDLTNRVGDKIRTIVPDLGGGQQHPPSANARLPEPATPIQEREPGKINATSPVQAQLKPVSWQPTRQIEKVAHGMTNLLRWRLLLRLPFPKRSTYVKIAIIGVFLGPLLTLIAVIGGVLGYLSIINQYDAKINALQQSVQVQVQSARIFDANGRVLYQLKDPNLGARIYVPLSQISPNMIVATVRVEDRRFYEDPGFDVFAIIRAVLQNVRAGGVESGAGSITQQLARALVLDPGAVQDRSTTRKDTEVIVASEIARRYTKSRIIEFYLNTVYYGNLAYGMEAAAQTYFNKDAKDLNLAQAAFLAGLIQSPAAYDPVQNWPAAMARYDDVLALMANTGCITMEHLPPGQNQMCVDANTINPVEVAQVKATVFKAPTSTAIYPHFVNYVEQQLEARFGKDAIYSSGFNVYTTIDPKVQDVAQAAATSEIARLKGANVNNAAVVAVRPSDGAVLAMVGSADFNNKDINGQFNVALAPRQSGSSIKPFIYAAALEDSNGSYWTPATIIWDVQSCFGTAPSYCPTNYDSQFHGPQPVRNALGNSFNVPAVKTLQYIGLDRFKDIANRVGITFPLTQPAQAGLASALGATEVPLIDMVQGYAVFANGGKRVDTYAITKVTRKNGDQEETVFEAKDHPATQVIDPNITYLITNILADNNARLLEFGANSSLRLRDGRPAAVKTGTTNNFKDNWTIGFTPQLVVGVWVGNSNNTPMRVQSGISGAAPIWNTIMTQALAGQPLQEFPAAPNVTQLNVCADFGTQDFQECQTHGTEIFAQPNVPPPPGNVLKTLQVDTFSGLIANEYCPDFVQARTFLIVNDDTAVAWLNNDPRGQQWAQAHNVQLPVVPVSALPTTACDANTPRPRLVVTGPTPNSTVQGLLEIRGMVSIPGFNRYQIEVSPGFNTSNFQIVFGPSQKQASADNSLLGTWDTNSVQNGPYTLRLWAVDGQGHHAEITVPITVNNLATPQPGTLTLTPIVINPNPPATANPPTPTPRSIFPPTSTPRP